MIRVVVAALVLVGCGGGGGPNELKSARDARAIRLVGHGAQEQGEWIPLDAAQLDELRGIAGGLGDWPHFKCAFEPSIRVVFTDADGASGTMEICFTCGEVQLVHGGKETQRYLKPVRRRAVAWAKRLFQDDPDIQALSSKSED